MESNRSIFNASENSLVEGNRKKSSIPLNMIPDLAVNIIKSPELNFAKNEDELFEENIKKGIKIDATSKLLAQHFGVIRELKFYVDKFVGSVDSDEDNK